MSLMFAPMTGAWNLAGFPAASVPVPAGGAGLPRAVQLVAAPGREQVLLDVAAQLERGRGWPRHAPGFAPAGAGAGIGAGAAAADAGKEQGVGA
jgi:amidase